MSGSVSKFEKTLNAELLERFDANALPEQISGVIEDTVGKDAFRSIILGNEDAGAEHDSIPESIILAFKRPSLLVQDNTFDPAPSEHWNELLKSNRKAIEKALPSVGRIELKNHELLDWCGTGCLLPGGIVLTNRHVAETFVSMSAGVASWKTNEQGKKIRARIDFREEYDRPDESEFYLEDILHIEPAPGPDLAVFSCPKAQNEITPIELRDTWQSDQPVAAIGYPWEDSRVSYQVRNIMKRIFGGIYDVKRLAPGLLKTGDEQVLRHDCSTLGGNSGSALIDIESGHAVGLHARGASRLNEAVSAKTIGSILQDL